MHGRKHIVEFHLETQTFFYFAKYFEVIMITNYELNKKGKQITLHNVKPPLIFTHRVLKPLTPHSAGFIIPKHQFVWPLQFELTMKSY